MFDVDPKPCFTQPSRFHIAAFVLIFIGCGDGFDTTYPISGKIVFSDGSPARFGLIEFRSESDDPVIARGKINKDGTFSAKTSGKSGLVVGSHQLIILQVVPRNAQNVVHDHGHEVTAKYRSYDTSGLRIEVKENGKNHFPLTVEAK